MRRLAASISKTLPPRRRLACYALGDKVPDTAAAAFIAPSASIIGAVDVAEDASVWYNCTIRGDVASISIGPRTNIQDNTVIHVDSDALGGSGSTPTIIGADCTIGHMALLHACTLGDGAFVGMSVASFLIYVAWWQGREFDNLIDGGVKLGEEPEPVPSSAVDDDGEGTSCGLEEEEDDGGVEEKKSINV